MRQMGDLEVLNELEQAFNEANRQFKVQEKVVRNSKRCGNPEIELMARTRSNRLLARLFRLRSAIERCEAVYWENVWKKAVEAHNPENDEFEPKDLTGNLLGINEVI